MRTSFSSVKLEPSKTIVILISLGIGMVGVQVQSNVASEATDQIVMNWDVLKQPHVSALPKGSRGMPETGHSFQRIALGAIKIASGVEYHQKAKGTKP
jgi:hypothetical protein